MKTNAQRKKNATYQYNMMSMNETYTKRTRIFIGRIVDGDDSTESRIFLILFLLYIWSH